MLTSVEQIREEFDATFARPRRDAASDLEAFLKIRAGERPYALRLAELAGIYANMAVTPVPSVHPAALGVCGIQGVGVPVFDLAQLLGEPKVSSTLHWLALSRGQTPIAFAFTRFEGYAEAGRTDLSQSPSSTTHLADEILRLNREQRPVVRMSTAVAFICDAENTSRKE